MLTFKAGIVRALGLAFLLAALPSEAAATERIEPAHEAETGASFDARRIRIQRAGTTSLTSWAIVNIAVGTAGHFSTEGRLQHFHQMNAMWNTVNLALGVIGMVSSYRQVASDRTLEESAEAARSSRKVYLINGGLDFAYIAAGTVSWVVGERRGSDRAVGFGESIVAQGVFLLVFDAAMALAHHRNLRPFRVGAVPVESGITVWGSVAF